MDALRNMPASFIIGTDYAPVAAGIGALFAYGIVFTPPLRKHLSVNESRYAWELQMYVLSEHVFKVVRKQL